jgi:hypothetical protein
MEIKNWLILGSGANICIWLYWRADKGILRSVNTENLNNGKTLPSKSDYIWSIVPPPDKKDTEYCLTRETSVV